MRKFYGQIIDLLMKAVKLARATGIQNLFQPGLIKEMIIADALGHELITTKRGADARNPSDHSAVYEYLSFVEGGSGQLDRMFKEPAEKRQTSLNRIRRNSSIYFAVFYKANQVKLKTVYKIEPDVVLKEAENKLDRSRNAISHIAFSEDWIKQNGAVIYKDADV